jgi:Rrf2 family protein
MYRTGRLLDRVCRIDRHQAAPRPARRIPACENASTMKLSAKADYAVRAVLVLAAHEGARPLKGELVARAQDLPLKFVENILGELKHAGVVASQRGPEGGYRLAVPASEISIADVIRIVDGPIAAVAGVRPDEVTYPPGAEALPGVWLEARGMLRSVLQTTTFADLVERSRVLSGQGERRAPRVPARAKKL